MPEFLIAHGTGAAKVGRLISFIAISQYDRLTARDPFADLKESVMGVIAWIFLGLLSGLLASHLIPGTRAQGLAFNCAIGTAGALAGGWTAVNLLHLQALSTFFNLSTWLTALIGAAIMLLAYYALTSRANEPGLPGPGMLATVPVRHPRTRR
jgi:uncharacterized membrane protein YeaQ/YmgE (transglycosylase-associated protein family)